MRFWPFKTEKHADGRIALGNFNLTAQLPNQRSVQVAGYIYSDDDREALDKRLDMYQEVIERQRLRCEIPELEAAREQKIKALQQAGEVLAELLDKQKNGEKLSSQEALTIRNLRTNIDKANEDIDRGAQAIAEAKKKAGVG